MASPVLQFKRGAFANLPGLRAGEPALTTDSFDLYVGIDSTTNGNKFFGSHRYWTKETTTVGSGINLVEGTSNGSDFIQLKSPDSLSGITTYTFPATPTNDYFLKTNADGDLSWAEVVSNFYVSADSGASDNVSTGSTLTFTGGTNVNTAVTDNVITINLDDGISLTNVNASGIVTASTLAGVTTVDATTKATLEAVLGSEPNTFTSLNVTGVTTTNNLTVNSTSQFTGGASFSSLIIASGGIQGDLTGNVTGNVTGNINSAGVSTFANADITSLSVSGVSTFTGAIDANGGANISGGETILSSATVSDLTDTRLVIAGTSGALTDSADLTFASNVLTVVNTIDVTTVEATNLKAKDGTAAITITDSTGAVATSSDLTVGGNLYVNGSTTQVNTSSLTVEDRTIELGIVNGSAPSSSTTWDLGVLFNYYQTSAKKSAVVWEHADARFKFASEVSDGGGTDNDSPQITFTAFAPIEISALWVNDCAGQSQVISCTGSERFLENITVDAGTF